VHNYAQYPFLYGEAYRTIFARLAAEKPAPSSAASEVTGSRPSTCSNRD
jgi:hypothetical protein